MCHLGQQSSFTRAVGECSHPSGSKRLLHSNIAVYRLSNSLHGCVAIAHEENHSTSKTTLFPVTLTRKEKDVDVLPRRYGACTMYILYMYTLLCISSCTCTCTMLQQPQLNLIDPCLVTNRVDRIHALSHTLYTNLHRKSCWQSLDETATPTMFPRLLH